MARWSFPYALCGFDLDRVNQSGTLLIHICSVLELTFHNNNAGELLVAALGGGAYAPLREVFLRSFTR